MRDKYKIIIKHDHLKNCYKICNTIWGLKEVIATVKYVSNSVEDPFKDFVPKSKLESLEDAKIIAKAFDSKSVIKVEELYEI